MQPPVYRSNNELAAAPELKAKKPEINKGVKAPVYVPKPVPKPLEKEIPYVTRAELEGSFKELIETIEESSSVTALEDISGIQKEIVTEIGSLINEIRETGLGASQDMQKLCTELLGAIGKNQVIQIEGIVPVSIESTSIKQEKEEKINLTTIEKLLRELIVVSKLEDVVEVKNEESFIVSSEVTSRTKNGNADSITQVYSDGTIIEQKISYGK